MVYDTGRSLSAAMINFGDALFTDTIIVLD